MSTIEPGELDLDAGAGVTPSDQRPTRPTATTPLSPNPCSKSQQPTSLPSNIANPENPITNRTPFAINDRKTVNQAPSNALTQSPSHSSHLKPNKSNQLSKPNQTKDNNQLITRGQIPEADKLTRVSTWQTYHQSKSRQRTPNQGQGHNHNPTGYNETNKSQDKTDSELSDIKPGSTGRARTAYESRVTTIEHSNKTRARATDEQYP
jgi:hypothetical protein